MVLIKKNDTNKDKTQLHETDKLTLTGLAHYACDIIKSKKMPGVFLSSDMTEFWSGNVFFKSQHSAFLDYTM